MKRYNIGPVGLGEINIEEDDKGEWVRFEDVVKLTDEQENAIVAAYGTLYDEYKTCLRKRDPFFKEVASKHWKEKLLVLQTVMTEILNIDVTFKEF